MGAPRESGEASGAEGGTSERRIRVITIFPELIESFLAHGVVRIARERGLADIQAVNLRDFAEGPHRVVDDYPFGGGAGMVLKVEPIARAIQSAREEAEGLGSETRVILLSPQGKPYNQTEAERLFEVPDLTLLCGHYKGVDERVREHLIDEEISLGDFILSGGEIAAMAVVDSLVRLIPGVLSDLDSALTDSFSTGLIDCAYYTRPREFQGWTVPEVLISGNHAAIEEWRRADSLKRTARRRPDLLEEAADDEEDGKVDR